MNISEETVAQAAQGDRQAFAMIYRQTAAMVYNLSLRMLRNREDAAEVTQDVFVTVYNKLPQFRGQSALKTWIYRIAVNLAMNTAKKNLRYRKQVPYEDSMGVNSVAPDTVRAETDRTRRRQIIDGLLQRLNPAERTCILLRNQEGLSYREIADVLRVNINTVRSRLKRAREKLLAGRRDVYEQL